MYCPIKFGCKKIRSPEDMLWQKKSFLIIWALTMTLNLKTAKQSSCMTLRPMIMHHYTKFG